MRHRHNAKRGRGVVVAIALVTAAVAGAPAVARADPPAPGSTSPHIALAGLPAWVPVGGTMAVQLHIENAPPDAQVSVVAYPAVTPRGRIAFEQTLRGEKLGTPVGVLGAPVAALPVDSTGARAFTVGLQGETGPRDQTRLPLRRTGVYPVEVELLDGNDKRLDGFIAPVVAVVVTGGTPALGQKLDVAWVWPLTEPPAYRAEGKPDARVLDALRPDGRVARQSLALLRHNVPVSIVPGPETLESWGNLAKTNADLGSGFDATLQDLKANQVLTGPFVPIDVPSLLNAGLGEQVDAELTLGKEKLSSMLGVRLDPRTQLARPVSSNALARLREANVDRVIVDDSALVPVDESFTSAEPFVLDSPGRTVTGLASDGGLGRLLDGNDAPALRAQRFLAGLAVVALEQPNKRRGVVVVNPDDWDVPAALIDAALAGLNSEHPLVQPVTVDQLLTDVPVASTNGPPVGRDLAPSAPAPAPVGAEAFRSAQAQLQAFRTLLTAPSLRTVQGDTALLVALSSAWKGEVGRAQARASLGVIGNAIGQFLAGVQVPVNSTVTITARRARIPVTFLNQTGQTLRIRVRLESDKLLFPDGAQRELELAPRTTTIGFTVELRSSGTFPLRLVLTSPDGSLRIQETKVQVRSTFVSGVGLFLTVGAVLFLALWWGNDFRKRRKRRVASAAETHEAPAAVVARGRER